MYRADRGTRGGGVVIYVDMSLNSKCIVSSIEPINFESIFVKITFHANKSLIVGSIYRPPSAPTDSLLNILNTISSLDKSNTKELIILGDFNRNWLDHSSTKGKNLIKSVNLTQLINEPTRVNGQSSSLLDWILVTNPERIIT